MNGLLVGACVANMVLCLAEVGMNLYLHKSWAGWLSAALGWFVALTLAVK